MANLTDQDVLDDDKLPVRPASQATHFYLFDKNSDTTFLGEVADVLKTLLPAPSANKPPLVTLAVSPNGITLGDTTDLTATATDPDGVIASVTFFDGTTALAALTTPPFVFRYKPTTVGTHQIKAVAIDNGGASASTSLPLVVVAAPVAANQPPTVGLSLSASSVQQGQSVTLTATPADADGTVASVAFYDGATLLQTVTSAPYTYAYTPGAGNHALKAIATDNSGATGASPVQTLTVTTPVGPAPTVSLEINPNRIAAGGTSQLFATPASANSTIASVAFYDGPTLITTLTQAPAQGPWQYGYSPVTSGQRNLTAVATDALGVSSQPSTVQVLTVDAAPIVYNTPLSYSPPQPAAPAGTPGEAFGIVFVPASTQVFSFNSNPNTLGSGVSMQITDSSNGSVNPVDFPDDYSGLGFSFKRADGQEIPGTFPAPNGTLNFTL